MAKREMSKEDQLIRYQALQEIQKAFPYTEEGFLLFAQTCISELIPGNPDLNRVQADICKWLFGGPLYRMVQAQRGQAKTTLTAIYAVFRLIHMPNCRVLIVSAGGKMSKEIASFVIQIINGLDFLDVLCADKNAGDHESVEWYDIHWLFKGVEKSPSVKCLGVDSSVQGSRSDVLIADDIESMKNSRTVVTREVLEDLTKEFEAVCAKGDIIYLGTPQSIESVYNNLPSRGYEIRIWPGRYPTLQEEEEYGEFLAPMLKADMLLDPNLREGYGLDGESGRATCPEMFDEELLLAKELSLGKAKFKLQYMLNTTLSDTDRYPLKISNLIVAPFNNEQGPVLPIWSNDVRNMYRSAAFGSKFKVYRAVDNKYELRKFEQTVMYIDPAGGGKNGDEMAYAIIKLIGAYVYIAAIGGVPGGYEEAKLLRLVQVAKEHGAKTICIEKNYGNGAHANMIKPLFSKAKWPVTIEEVYESGQKELRIIDIVEPLLSSHRLVISPKVLELDAQSTSGYALDLQLTYRLIHQMAMLTRDKGCLRHDDRLDALAGAIRFVIERLDFDTQVVIEAKRRAEEVARIAVWNDPISRRVWLTGVQESQKTRHNRNRFNSRNSFSRRRKNGKTRNRFS
jgi:hypothetical protein